LEGGKIRKFKQKHMDKVCWWWSEGVTGADSKNEIKETFLEQMHSST
jgi:hypothetical protein